ncbi:mechanosensitive ion channel domain-containing protein [uncultured Barnesiella sp.]|uniref:mechanosensitive ion channel family protein n=1 Tax=uncultured Barnesiella sp. TaxID=584861 RepID=UPI0026175019|nr:mechanosensitive ion channel domain-containing protein [uncultured Barnesiella sp.]
MLESVENSLHAVAGLMFDTTEIGYTLIYVILIVLIAVVCDVVCKLLINKLLLPVIRRTKFEWDDHLYDKKVVARLAALAPAFILYAFLPSAFEPEGSWYVLSERICKVYIIALILRFLNGMLNAFLDIFNEKEELRHYPIKGGIQTLQVILFSIGFISIVGTIIDESPARLFAGLGASAAVLMLIFKDTILGFVAGIQLSANNMLHKGDWITAPAHNANGIVQDVTLNTVKVRNFDNTTTTIPPYALVSGSFTNWRSMFESGGRRITRQILLDVNSITFLDEEELHQFESNFLIGEFVSQRLQAIADARAAGNRFLVEELRVTNTLLFRVYLENYIRQMGKSNPDMLYMVRYLPMAEKGLPVELYLFSSEKVWKIYEGIAADLMDHTLGITREFGLRIYQSPGSYDFQSLKDRLS